MITVYDENTTPAVLENIELVRPNIARSKWKGIQHGELVNSIKTVIEKNDFNIEKESYSLSKDETGLVGAFNLNHPTIDIGEDQTLSLGFSTSNSLKRSLQLFVGSEVKVCTNGMVTGEVVLERKHTINFDLMRSLDTALVNYMYRAQEIPLVTESLKTYELTQRQSDLILMEAGRRGFVPWSRIGKVEHEYRYPTYSDHNERSSWGLLNAFTHVIKESPAQNQMAQMNQFRGILPTKIAN